MKSHVKSKIIILISLGMLFAFSPIITTNLNFISGNSNKSSEYKDDNNLDKKNLKFSAVSGKININGNSGWSNAKTAGICTGNGTYSEPYIIKNLIINGNGTGSCILIQNSDVYFTIENCTIYNSGTIWQDSAIELVSVYNGLINNSEFYNNAWGVYLDYAENNTIVGNTFDGERGIYLGYSNFNTLYLNDLITSTMNLFAFTQTSSNNLWNSPIQLNYTYNNNSYTNYLGNFWNDHGGNDADADGIVDAPVVFLDSIQFTVDYYPLKEEFENYELIDMLPPSDVPGGDIPGYNIFVLLGILLGTVILISKKLKKS